jgi:predicted amidohydrolase YtcJ
MQAAVDRRSAAGEILGANEGITPERALALFTGSAAVPGGAARTLGVGSPADLCLLDVPWSVARERLSIESVRATFRNGVCIWDSAGSGS